MAKLPSPSKLQAEDFKDQIDWISKLISPLNQFIEQVNSALNKSLTLDENTTGAIKTVTLDGTFPVRISWDKPKPLAVLVGGFTRKSPVPDTAAPQIKWSFNQNGQLQIDAVYGITPTSDDKYTITLVCLS